MLLANEGLIYTAKKDEFSCANKLSGQSRVGQYGHVLVKSWLG